MKTADKLRQLKESERRNQEHERRFREEQENMENKKPWNIAYDPTNEPKPKEETPTGSRYTLTRAEREVTIRFDAEERIAHIYASDPVYIRRLDKLCEEDPKTYRCVKVDPLGYFKQYEVPADRVAFRKGTTDEHREAARRRMEAQRKAGKI